MTDGNNNVPNPAAPATVPGNTASSFRVFETKEQYEAAVNRKLANYVPKTEYQAAFDRASSLEKSLGTLQAENAKLSAEISKLNLDGVRAKVAKEAGLPAEWADELRGVDEAGLKEHAEALRKKLGIKTNVGNPVPGVKPGNAEGPSENDVMNGVLLGLSRGIPLTGR